jgi:WD40 repeat protein
MAPNGKTLAGAIYQTVRLWDPDTGKEQGAFTGPARIIYLTFAPDGKRLALVDADRFVRVWDAVTGSELLALSGHEGPLAVVAFTPDGKTLVSGGGDPSPMIRASPEGNAKSELKLWDAQTGKSLGKLKAHDSPITGLAFTPDGQTLVTGSRDGMLKVWDWAQRQVRQELSAKVPTDISRLAIAPDGRTLAVGGLNGSVQLWELTTGTEKDRLQGHQDRVNAVAFSPGGQTLASSSDDRTVIVWDWTAGRPRATLKGHRGHVLILAFGANEHTLASSSADGTVKLWDAVKGQERLTLAQERSVQ